MELGVVLDLAIADHNVGAAGDDRFHQLKDVFAAVLVVRIGVDDDVSAKLQTRVHACLEGDSEALVRVEADDVVDAALTRDLGRVVGRAIVDDQPLDSLEPGHLAG